MSTLSVTVSNNILPFEVGSVSTLMKGDTGTLNSVTVEMLPTDGIASSIISGDLSNADLLLKIPKGDKGANSEITSATVTTGVEGSTASVELGGTPLLRTLNFTIPKGDSGIAGTIQSLTVATGVAGTAASVVTGGTPTARTFALTIPRGDKGVDGSFTQKAYTTYTAMDADKVKIPANTSVTVTNDTDSIKNGMYAYNGTVFTKSAYDPLAQSKVYADNQDVALQASTLLKVQNVFATKALMTASTLPNGSSAKVDSDTTISNNGYYKKSAGVWSYLTSNLSIDIADLVSKNKGEVRLNDYTAISAFVADSNKWIVDNVSYTGIIIPVSEGATYRVIGSDIAQGTRFYTMFAGNVTDDGAMRPADLTVLAAGATKDITIGKNYKYLWISSRIDGGTLKAALPKSVTLTNSNFLSAPIMDGQLNELKEVDKYVKNIADKNKTFIEPFIDQVNAFEDISFLKTTGKAVITNAVVTTAVDYPTLNTIELPLNLGDKLEFDYRPHLATILSQSATTGDLKRVLLKENIDDNNRIKSHSFTAYKSSNIRITGAILSTVKVNGVTLAPTSYTLLTQTSELTTVKYSDALPEYANYVASAVGADYHVRKGETVRVTNVGKNHIPISHKSTTNNSGYFAAYGVSIDNNINTVEWTASADTRVRLSGTTTSQFSIRKPVRLSDAISSTLYSNSAIDSIPMIYMPELEYVFATYQNYILKMETVNSVEKIAISTDLGETWSYTDNIVGDVTQCHFFTDGTIMICSPTKVFWTTDYVTLNESTVLDADGSVFVPTTWHFFGQQNSYKPMFVNGQELFAWGEYVQQNPNPRFWYTTDSGRTIKCGVKFGVTAIAGSVQSIKHVHTVTQHAKTERFYMTTGDFGNQCKLMSATYNFTSDTWIWTLHGQGDAYKFGALYFDDYYLYTLTDYTAAELQNSRGLLRAPLTKLNDINAFKVIYKAPLSEYGSGSPFKLIQDNNGYRVITSELMISGYIWLAKDNNKFRKVALSKDICLSYVLGANYNGDIYVIPNIGSELGINEYLTLSKGSYNLTKMLRNAGLTGFMRNRTMHTSSHNIV